MSTFEYLMSHIFGLAKVVAYCFTSIVCIIIIFKDGKR